MTAEEHQRWLGILSLLNERQERLYVAEEALQLGRGGVTKMSEIAGMSRPTIMKGIRELCAGIGREERDRIRRAGGGRKRISEKDPTLLRDLESLMECSTAGVVELPQSDRSGRLEAGPGGGKTGMVAGV